MGPYCCYYSSLVSEMTNMNALYKFILKHFNLHMCFICHTFAPILKRQEIVLKVDLTFNSILREWEQKCDISL